MGRVVVGYDGSEGAVEALRWACEDAELRHDDVEIVHAWHEPIAGVGAPMAPLAVLDPRLFEDAARQLLAAVVRHVGEEHPSVHVTGKLVVGGAGPGIVEAADGADLVVVGARGRHELAELVLGSVSQHVLHHATCPVVVMHEGRTPAAATSEGRPSWSDSRTTMS